MPEILFRGKREEHDFFGLGGEWVYGIPIKTHIGTFICFEENPHYCNQYGYMEIEEISKVIPETVGAFTGLTDKNGNKIFEGDIVQRKVNVYRLGEREHSGERILTGIVVWETHQHCTGSWALSAYDEFGNKANYLFDDSFEVVGNIHDNPELLEESNENT